MFLDPESDRLDQEKIEARLRLLTMPSDEAQKLAEQTLYPQHWEFRSEHWEFRSEDNIWEESIPTNYGEIDAS